MADWPEPDIDPGNGLRVGTWNLDRDRPLWRQPHQADHVRSQADLWLLTEVPANWQFGTANTSFSQSRPNEDDQYWSGIISRWHVEPIATKHPSLALARIDHPGEPFLAAASVFPWRGAAEFWPTGDGDTFADRCVNTLDAHAAEICEARCGLPVVWGGDFNQALSGRDYVGSDAGRAALLKAFEHLRLRAVTVKSHGQVPPHQSIDHIAIPQGGVQRMLRFSDHRSMAGSLATIHRMSCRSHGHRSSGLLPEVVMRCVCEQVWQDISDHICHTERRPSVPALLTVF